jgi:uncharacterized membrane protein YgdD (TMEM256/DUF423 family)
MRGEGQFPFVPSEVEGHVAYAARRLDFARYERCEGTGSMNPLMILAALSGACAVAAGAFGAHGATGAAQEWLRTGGQYQLIHAVAALVALRLEARGPAWLFVAGAAIFAGTLYLMALGLPRWLGAVTPVGGLLLILGWLWLALAGLRG